jgi:hypothetical protein
MNLSRRLTKSLPRLRRKLKITTIRIFVRKVCLFVYAFVGAVDDRRSCREVDA